MLFCIGGHAGYCVDGSAEDYQLIFEQEEDLELYYTDAQSLFNESYRLAKRITGNTYDIVYDDFDVDAIILKAPKRAMAQAWNLNTPVLKISLYGHRPKSRRLSSAWNPGTDCRLTPMNPETLRISPAILRWKLVRNTASAIPLLSSNKATLCPACCRRAFSS